MITFAPSDIISTYLIAEGTFTIPSDAAAWPLYKSYMPDKGNPTPPDNAGAIYDTEGLNDGRLMLGPNIFHYGFQIRIRSADYDSGWDKAVAVATLLEAAERSVTVAMDSSTTYELNNISQVGPVLPLGLEKGSSGRFLFTINFLATLKEA